MLLISSVVKMEPNISFGRGKMYFSKENFTGFLNNCVKIINVQIYGKIICKIQFILLKLNSL